MDSERWEMIFFVILVQFVRLRGDFGFRGGFISDHPPACLLGYSSFAPTRTTVTSSFRFFFEGPICAAVSSNPSLAPNYRDEGFWRIPPVRNLRLSEGP